MRSSQKAQMGIVLLTVLLSMIGIGILIPVLPLYARDFGASDFQIGLLTGVYPLCQFLFAPLIGKISDRFGRRPVLLVSLVGTAVGFFLMGAAGSLFLLFLARIIDGISGANIGIAQACIADLTTREERSRAMGLFGATIGVGFVLGPFLGGELSKISPSAPFYAIGALAVITFFLVLLRLPESLTEDKRSTGDRQPLGELFSHHTNGALFTKVILSYFLSTAGFTVMTTVWALFLKERFDYGPAEAGRLMAFIGIIAILMQGGVLRRLLKKGYRETSLALTGALILVVSLLALAFVGSLGTLLVVTAAVAIGNSLVSPTLNALASLAADSAWQGRALGVLQSAGSLARAAGALAGGWFLTLDVDKGAGSYAETALILSAVVLALTAGVIFTIRNVNRGSGETRAGEEA